MTAEGKPTGIRRGEFDERQGFEFEGERWFFRNQSNTNRGVYLELKSSGGRRIALYGYWGRGSEFMEVDRKRLS
jgi:hypothetical protein